MIDEKKLIEDLKNTFSDSVLNQTFGFGKYTLLEAVEEMINRQPQVETDTNVGSKWIPCEERLPSKKGFYQVTCEWEGKLEVYDLWYGDDGWMLDEDEGEVLQKVIAWQPLPAPYKKEGAENG